MGDVGDEIVAQAREGELATEQIPGEQGEGEHDDDGEGAGPDVGGDAGRGGGREGSRVPEGEGDAPAGHGVAGREREERALGVVAGRQDVEPDLGRKFGLGGGGAQPGEQAIGAVERDNASAVGGELPNGLD